MKSSRIVSLVSGLLAITLPIFIYVFHVQSMGFPDGHVTDFERGTRILFYSFAALSVFFGFYFFYSARVYTIKESDKPLQTAVLLYIALVATSLVIVYIMHSNLNSGAGG